MRPANRAKSLRRSPRPPTMPVLRRDRAIARRERSLRSTSREQCRQRRDDGHAERRSVDHQDRADNCRSWWASDLCGHGRQYRTLYRDRSQGRRSDAGWTDIGVDQRRLHDRLPLRSGDMAPGTTRTIAATYTVAGGTAAPPEITNAATVLGGIGDPNPANNRATIRTRIRSRAKCDVDGDGLDEMVTGAGPGGGPHVLVWSFAGGVVTDLASFYAYDPLFGGGVYVACGDVNGDGLADIVTGAGTRRRAARARLQLQPVATSWRLRASTRTTRYSPAALAWRRRCEWRRHGRHHHGGRSRRRATRARLQSRRRWRPEVASFYAYDPAFTGGVPSRAVM